METGERWGYFNSLNDNAEDILPSSEINNNGCNHYHYDSSIEKLEDEREILNASLYALTTHFAQVQLRLKQILDVPVSDKENLLKSLEEFAFRGIPDVDIAREGIDRNHIEETLSIRHQQQQQLLIKIKTQLNELERSAIINDATVSQNFILENPKLAGIDFDTNFCSIISKNVTQPDQPICLLHTNEHLVNQLKIQVADLERFIYYLQNSRNHAKCVCGCASHSIKKPFKTDAVGIIQRISMILQMLIMVHLRRENKSNKSNKIKNSEKVKHWGDIRARLEMAIDKVAALVKSYEFQSIIQEDDTNLINSYNIKIISAVRQCLAASIRDLMQHGAIYVNKNFGIVPIIGCILWKFNEPDTPMHAWEIILKYYHYKNGEMFNSAPARKLARSFNLQISTALPISSTQTLLSTVGCIISTHREYKRSNDSLFKAFVCAALNYNKLSRWLSLIFQCPGIISMNYRPWSYATKTSFVDALQSLDVLTDLKFNLPVDLAIQHFQNIEDIFT